MPARSPREATDAFLAPLRQAVACVTNAQLAGGHEPGLVHALFFNPNQRGYITLPGRHAIRFRLAHSYEVTQRETGWAVHTLA